jgi:hypothetical protein
MKKNIGYTLLVLIFIIFIGGFIGVQKFNNALFNVKPNHLEYTSESKPIHFDWSGNSIGGIYESQAAMTIPLKIDGLKHQFYMQFDTGAPISFIYEKDLKSLRKIGVEIKEVVKNEISYVENLDFVSGDNHIKVAMIQILKNYGHEFDKNDTIKRIGIGTIGSDFLIDKITSIDFKNQKIQFFDERPKVINSLSGFKKFDFSGRRIMLPVKVDNKDYEFLYDSGCSAFGLITIKSRFEDYTDINIDEIKYDAKSWKKSLPIRSKTSNKVFAFGNVNLEIKRVSYLDMYTFVQPLMTPFTRIGGWLGNQPFNESTLILDTKAEEFIILKN